MDRSLTSKQQRFVEEYLIDLNATQACIRAGYSSRNADKIGSELLGKTGVSAAVERAKARRAARTEITQDRVLQELAAIGFADPTYFNGSVKVADKATALKAIAEHLGMFVKRVTLGNLDDKPFLTADADLSAEERATRLAALFERARARRDARVARPKADP